MLFSLAKHRKQLGIRKQICLRFSQLSCDDSTLLYQCLQKSYITYLIGETIFCYLCTDIERNLIQLINRSVGDNVSLNNI